MHTGGQDPPACGRNDNQEKEISMAGDGLEEHG
jgi:hypothetical protein